MKTFTNQLLSLAFAVALVFTGFSALAQTDAQQDYQQQINPQEQVVTPIAPEADKNVTRSEKKTFSPSILVPPAGQKVKAKKGFFSKVLDKLNPLNWFGKKKAQMSTGVLLMLVGGAMLIGAIILGVVSVGTLSGGGLLLSSLLWAIGGILITVGFILWLVDLIQNS